MRLHEEISDLERRDTRKPRTLKKHVNNYEHRLKGLNAVKPRQWRKEEQSYLEKKVRKTVKNRLRRLNRSGIRSGQEREDLGEMAHLPVHSSHTQRQL